MSFTINRKSERILNRFANVIMDGRSRVRHYDGNIFMASGKDKIIGTSAVVAASTNRRGNITALMSFCEGEDTNSSSDDQFFRLDVDNPRKTVKWFSRNGLNLEPMYYDPSRTQSVVQSIANAASDAIPGLEGGPRDVYVAIGNYEAWA